MQYDTNQQPYQPQQLPKRKHKTWLWIVLTVVLLFICIGTFAIAGQAAKNTTSTVAPTNVTTVSTPVATATSTKPAPTQKWTTTHTFTGNGSKKTGTFSVPDDWKIVWKCTPASFGGIDYNVIIDVMNSDGTFGDGALNTTCSKAHAQGETEEHTGGSVYLDVTSEGDWVVSIQEMK